MKTEVEIVVTPLQTKELQEPAKVERDRKRLSPNTFVGSQALLTP